MKLLLVFQLSILLLFSIAPLSVAQQENLDELFRKARSLSFKKKFNQADKLYESFVPKMKRKYGPNSAVMKDVYLQWAENCQANGKNEKAIGLFKKLVVNNTSRLSTGDSAHIYDLMADSYMKTNQYSKAIDSYRRAMKLAGSFKFRRIYYLSKLAPAYEKAMDYTNAEQSWKKALKLADVDLGSRKEYVKMAQKHPLGPKHALEESVDSNILELVDSLHGLGAFYSNRGKYLKAEPYLKRAKSVIDVWVPLTFKNPSFFYDYSKVLAKLNRKKQSQKVKAEGQKIQAALEVQRIKYSQNAQLQNSK